jgi:phosphopantetheine adenylyltransferase
MRLTHLRNRTQTAVETAMMMSGTHSHDISAQTVRNIRWYQSISSTCWKSTYSSPTTCAHAMVEAP